MDKPVAEPVAPNGSITPEFVEQYLRDHPNFLLSRPDLLLELELPHGGSGAVSLVERQVSLLRERNIDMRNRLAHLTSAARQNDSRLEGTQAVILELLECIDAASMAATLTAALPRHLSVDHAALCWLPEAGQHNPDLTPVSDPRASVIARIMKGRSPLVGVMRAEEMAALFATEAGEGSAAVAPLLRGEVLLGVVAVGADDPHRYQSDDGTVFLDFLAGVILRLPQAGLG